MSTNGARRTAEAVAAIEAAVALAQDRFGTVDVLRNTAGWDELMPCGAK